MPEAQGPDVFVIAEAGVNHNGEAKLAFRLVEAAAAAGADAVKFQTFTTDKVVVPDAPKAAYQTRTTGTDESQAAMLRRLELPRGLHHELAAHCRAQGIEFMSTPFDEDSARFLAEEVGVARLKVPSGEITNGPLLLAVARAGLPLIVSTGMSTIPEIEAALGVLAFGMVGGPDDARSRDAFTAALNTADGRRALAERVTLLHCTSEYPTPYDDVNLCAMATLEEAFGLPVGLSDHTPGIAVPIAAVARGAKVVEKHFTLDRGLPGPDHGASLEPDELVAMTAGVRAAAQALGSPEKAPSPSEAANRPIVRRSLVATAAIHKGEAFTETNLGARRPGTGVDPMRYWDFLGRPAARDYQAGEMIDA